MKISVILPAYNEENTIERIVVDIDKIFKKRYNNYEIIVVNDNSTDNTLKILDEVRKKVPRLRFYSNPRNLGKTKSLIKIINITDSEILSFIDADYQYEPRDLPRLIDKVIANECDICIGRRKIRKDNHLRLFASFAFNLWNYTLFSIKVKDINCGIKAFHRRVFEKIIIEYLNAKWFFDTELLAKAYKEKYRVKDMQITHYSRKMGISKVSIYKLAFETVIHSLRLWLKLFLRR